LDNRSTPTKPGLTSSGTVRVDAGVGIFWFIGWLFTISFPEPPTA
jgi:hypothetical protein